LSEQVKGLTKSSVFSTVGPFTLEDGELNGLLIVDNSGKSSLLDGRNLWTSQHVSRGLGTALSKPRFGGSKSMGE
jgi:hypothetical protein